MHQEREDIKKMLRRNRLTQVWLIGRLDERGVITDKAEMCSALAGTRKGAKVELILYESLTVLRDYETRLSDSKVNSDVIPPNRTA